MEKGSSTLGLLLFFAVVFIVTLFAVLAWLGRDRVPKAMGVDHIQAFEFPASVTRGVMQRYPVISEQTVAEVMAQLRIYFLTCKEFDGKPVGMPSQLVDTAWHSFILSTRSYSSFCQQAFGFYLHHTPEYDGDESDEYGFGRMVKGARLYGGVALGIPTIFSLDAMAGVVKQATVFNAEQLEMAATRFDTYQQRSAQPTGASGSGDAGAACSGAAACGCGGGSC